MSRIESLCAGIVLLTLLPLAPGGRAAAEGIAPGALLMASPDITISLGGLLVPDEGVVEDDLAGTVLPMTLGELPAAADVEGFHLEVATGDRLLVFDTTVALPGGVTAEPRDVVRFDGGSFSIEFDGSANGLPPDAGIDAVTRVGGDLLVSFDTTVDLDGVTAADEDLVLLGAGGPSVFLDGSALAVPIPATLDVDAAHASSDGMVLVSFDGAGDFAGFEFADEDVLEIELSTGAWALVFDGSTAVTPWPETSDIDAIALPEPSLWLQLATGIGFLVVVGRRRR